MESTATYIDSLVTTSPDGGVDAWSTCALQIQFLKGALKRTLPNVTGDVSVGQAVLNTLKYAMVRNASETTSATVVYAFPALSQLQNGNASPHQGAFYRGYFDASASARDIPTGWGILRNGVGDYNVTHNLALNLNNSDAPAVIVRSSSRVAAGLCLASVTSLGANSFQVKTYNGAGTAQLDAHVMFMVAFP